MAAEPRITVYTNLFTLASKEPATNRYVEMFFIWLSYLIRKGRPAAAYLMIDSRTFSYVASTPLFAALSAKLTFPMYALTYDPPATLKEGTLRRFEVERLVPLAERRVFFYLDVDVLPIRPLSGLIAEFKPNCLYYAAESIPTESKLVFLDKNYFGHLATAEDAAWLETRFAETGAPGMTSGIFGFTAGERIGDFFKYIRDQAAADSAKQFYTLDQPYYAAAIYRFIMRDGLIDNVGLDPAHIGVNIPSYQAPTTKILLNFCGDPGDESSHWFKMFTELILDAAF